LAVFFLRTHCQGRVQQHCCLLKYKLKLLFFFALKSPFSLRGESVFTSVNV